ncbi:hypothetical protein A9Q84_04770 [Halobacteriovorax marinus]|uniref:Secreted protein n=1 Tax=Halobacteriovorax marinus TaxID=97084 RepID=A0A1Y5FAN0_9BACT|nr:hypothetical protein A9Q84_04770 [Halobacteriovorax marinus]
MIRKILFIISFIFIQNTWAINCPSSFSPKEVAIEIFKLELSGARVDGMSDHKCMKQDMHPHIKVVSDPSNEEASVPKYFMGRKDPFKLGRLVIIDAETFTYKAIFEFQAKNKANKSEKVRMAFQFFLYKDKPNQSKYGCGAVIEAPEFIVLYDDCKEED